MVLRYQEQKERQEWLVLWTQKERFEYRNLIYDVNIMVWDHLQVSLKFKICMLHLTIEKRTTKLQAFAKNWYLLHCVINFSFFQINLRSFNGSLSANLPVYARPVFLRLSEEIPVTGTFKMRKVALAKQGFNPEECSKTDDLYYFDSTKKEYMNEKSG